MLRELIEHLAGGDHLDESRIQRAADALVDGEISAQVKSEFLCQLALKGETVEEITEFARVLRKKSLVPPIDAETRKGAILDVVGTGGDRLGTFNISTSVAIICAAAGVTVAKHGNRAATSQCGTADVLEALGIPIELSPEDAAKALKQHGFVFFFAPKYHPAFKHVAAARKLCADRGQRTIFNYLGPLLNPGSPSCALIGVANPTLCEPLAKVLQSLGMHRGMVVCGQCRVGNEIANVDELSTIGQNTIAEFYQANGFTISESAPDLFPIQNATIEDLKGGDRERNAAIVRAVLTGEERGPKRDIVLLNAAAALFVAGHADSLIEGWEAAATTIDCGDASRKLTALRQSRN